MSSQSLEGIPFSVSQTKQQFRLLELPPELVDIISASELPTLQFKSAPTLESLKGQVTPASKAQSNLHLVTQDRSFQVRQVNTSNSVYIIEPGPSRSRDAQSGNLEDEDTNTHRTQQSNPATEGLLAVGQVSSVLELIPASYNVYELLRRRLHTWSGGTSAGQDSDPLAPSTKAAIFADTPCADRDILQAWRDIGAVESTYGDHTVCLRPSAVAARDGWKGLLQGCAAEGVDLSTDNSFERVLSSYETKLGGSETVAEIDVMRALLECLGEPIPEGFSLSKDRVVRWVGTKILQADCEEKSAWSMESDNPQRQDASDFLASWRDMLPEAWRDDASLSRLGPQGNGRYRVIEDGNFIEYWEGVGDESHIFNTNQMEDSGTSLADGKTTNSLAGKRKWHEKFREARDKRAR